MAICRLSKYLKWCDAIQDEGKSYHHSRADSKLIGCHGIGIRIEPRGLHMFGFTTQTFQSRFVLYILGVSFFHFSPMLEAL